MGIRRKDKPKIVVLLGPTASGKSDLAVLLAKKFNGEIISADSRQVYKGMDIGSGKITKREMLNIPHHLINVASPKIKFSAGKYQKLAEKSIESVLAKEKLPIICGGTAFYIKNLVEGIELPNVSPNWKLRKELEKKDSQELYRQLKKLDPKRAKKIEKGNPRRLIRALEIVLQTNKTIPSLRSKNRYNVLILGIKRAKLEKRIKERLEKRLKKGMVSEVRKLRNSGISFKRLESFGLEYEWVAKYLQGKISRQEMKEILLRDIIKFSKKQMAWWKNDKKITWIKKEKEAERIIKKFLK